MLDERRAESQFKLLGVQPVGGSANSVIAPCPGGGTRAYQHQAGFGSSALDFAPPIAGGARGRAAVAFRLKVEPMRSTRRNVRPTSPSATAPAGDQVF
jgi:hypothetical protein